MEDLAVVGDSKESKFKKIGQPSGDGQRELKLNLNKVTFVADGSLLSDV